jgi:cytochrome b subunit of formate dehydrogenase
MDKVLLVYLAVICFILAVVIFLSLQSDEFLPRKLSRVRIRVDENNRRQSQEPRDDEFEMQPKISFLVLCAIVFFILILAGNG